MAELKSVMRGEYIALSFGISFAGAYCGINTCEQFRLSSKEKPKLLSRRFLMMLMAISIGGVAIWSMHFVGMSSIAFEDSNGNPVPVRYRKDLTALSLIVVIILCYAGIYICSKDSAFVIEKVDTIEEFVRDAAHMSIAEIKTMRSATYIMILALFKDVHRLVIGGFITAFGVCVMHYLGIAATVTDAKIEYDIGVVAASILIAIVAATAGYWILFRLLALYPHIEFLRLISSFIVAVAVNGMHYTGMAATRYVYVKGFADTVPISETVSSEAAVIGAIASSTTFILVILLITTADLRAWFYINSRTVRAADELVKSLACIEHPLPPVREALRKYLSVRRKHQLINDTIDGPCDLITNQAKKLSTKESKTSTFLNISRFRSGVVTIDDLSKGQTV